jgi:hypothetical protein
MNTEPEEITANELVVCCKNVDEPDTTKLLPVTVKTLPENLNGTNICSSLMRAIMQIYLLL